MQYVWELEHQGNCQTGEDVRTKLAEVFDLKTAFVIMDSLNYTETMHGCGWVDFYVGDADGKEIQRPEPPQSTDDSDFCTEVPF